jgi:tetratricopeptide (TPR) repeat protein
LNGLGLSLYEKGDLQEAYDCFHEVFKLAQETGNDELSAPALHNLGSIAWTRGKLSEARELLEKAQQIQQRTQDQHGLAETLNSLGLVLEGLGQWDEAIAAYRNALEQMQTVADFYGQSQVLVNIGNVHSLKGESKLAISCHEQVYEIATELGNPRLQGQALTALGDAYRMAGELDKAENHLVRAIEIKTNAGEARSLKHNWQSLGAVYHQQKRPAEALSAYEKGLQIALTQRDRRMEAFTLLHLSTLFTAQEKFQDASAYLKDAKEIAAAEEYNDCLGWIYEQEADIELLSEQPSAAKILESFSLSLWHLCQFNEYELRKLIDRLSRFWLAHAEDGQAEASIWFCDSIIQLWKNIDQGNDCTSVSEAFLSLKDRIAATFHP